MKFVCETVMILWHNKDPIYSLDFDSNSNRLCTTGSDNDVKIWSYQKNEDGKVEFTFLSSLSKHTKHVNVARFSPGGNLLASGSDDGTVVIWRLNPQLHQQIQQQKQQQAQLAQQQQSENPTTTPSAINLNGDNNNDDENKETWTAISVLRVTTDSYDISWSPNGLSLTTCSTDHTFQIWNPITRSCIQGISEHTHYVQGVSWDPLGKFLVTESADGSCRLYENSNTKSTKIKNQKNKQLVQLRNVISRRVFTDSPVDWLNGANEQQQQQQQQKDQNTNNSEDLSSETNNTNTDISKDHEHRMYYDECVSSFFRRPGWSPDGSFFITPTGQFKSNATSKLQSTSYLFSRHIPNRPIIHLPSNKPTFTVKFNPLLYKLDKISQISDIDYKMIFAISTSETIVLYDTQSLKPILVVSDLHYAPITDMSWSSDGLILMVTSQDGFCSYLSFESGEFGTPLPEEQWPQSMKEAKQLRLEAYQNTLYENVSQQQQQQQQQQQESLKRKMDDETSNSDSNEQAEKKQKTDDNSNNSTTSSSTTTTEQTVNGKPKRRIQATLISK